MSQFCPLCGNIKATDSVFCNECKNKIEKEYEVEIPNNTNDEKISVHEKPNSLSNENDLKKSIQIDDDNILENKSEKIEPESDKNLSTNKKKKSKWRYFFWLGILAAGIIIGFSYYANSVRRNFLDKSHWDAATQTNTIAAYIDYMLKFPKGKFYEQAEQNISELKEQESGIWQKLYTSENNAELRDFISQHPQSAYNPLIKKRLDSLEWVSAVKDNSKESYSKYVEMVQRNEFAGIYLHDAEKRRQLLSQTYPVNPDELDSLKYIVDGFFSALTSLNVENLEKYLAPRVYRFFGPGGGTKEKIIGDMLISGSKSQSPIIHFSPEIAELTYEKNDIEHFKINLPIQKTIVDSNGKEEIITGFIVQMELDQNYQIVTILENEPRYR